MRKGRGLRAEGEERKGLIETGAAEEAESLTHVQDLGPEKRLGSSELELITSSNVQADTV